MPAIAPITNIGTNTPATIPPATQVMKIIEIESKIKYNIKNSINQYYTNRQYSFWYKYVNIGFKKQSIV
jgi:hypothetical protein